LNGFAIVSAAHFGAGIYEVITNKAISNCAGFITIGQLTSTSVPPGGYGTVVQRGGNFKGVFVETFNTTGALTDLSFMLFVSCQ